MVIFPLDNWWARVALWLIAIFLGLIFSMLAYPAFWRRLFRRKDAQRETKNDAKPVKK